jgi:hypothetical protein
MAKAAVLNVDIVATAEKALETFDKVKEKSGASFSAMKVGAIAAAGAILAGLGEATKAASEHETGVAKLAQAYKDAGVSTKGMNSALEEIDTSSRRTGQSAEDNIAAYTKLVASTHSASKAQEELATAQDLAAFKGISVADAAQMLNSIQAGNTRTAKELGIATKDMSGHQLSATAIMENLSKAVKGQADAMGNTAAGQMARYKESMEQAKVAVGEALLPALTKLLAMLQPLFAWMSRNTSLIKTLTPIVAALAGAVLVAVGVMKAYAVAQQIANIAMEANPIGVIVVAVEALIIALVLMVMHWKQVVTWVSEAWAWLRNLGAWILAHWKIIVDVMLGPLGLLITNFRTVENVIHDVIKALEEVGHAVSDALGWLGKIPKGAGGLISKINPFSLPGGGGGPAPAPVFITVNATPGADLPEVVYQALRDYQRRHVRPELRPLFAGR